MSTPERAIAEVTPAPGQAVVQRVTAVVGFDGSEPSQRALATAAQLVSGRQGSIEVVYVAHVGTAESMTALAAVEIEETFEQIAGELEGDVARTLGQAQEWTFHRADGDIARSLIAEAEAQAKQDGTSQVVIVIGIPQHRYHQVLGSVATALVHHSDVPLLMVP